MPGSRPEAESGVNLQQTIYEKCELHRLCKLPPPANTMHSGTGTAMGCALLWLKRRQARGGDSSAMGDKGDPAEQRVEQMPADGMWIHFQFGGSVQASMVSEARILQYGMSSYWMEKPTFTMVGKAPLRV